MTARGRDRLALALLAALAYLPALASSPGRMPADTKLYLYLDPGGLIGRAASTLETEQFAGWVPHQQITYLWPSGPWFWLFDTIGSPDWVAHRLWIGTILFAAGAGAFRVARLLGIGPVAALTAGAMYELSPYLLAYVSRTSLLLLPWAALGWIVAVTIVAASEQPSEQQVRSAATPAGAPWRSRPAADAIVGASEQSPAQQVGEQGSAGDRPSHWRARVALWRGPALIALIVATVGSVNATALALIVPGPVLWLAHAAGRGSISWRRALGFALRTGALCVVVSAWWIAMLVVQSRYGAPVLAYSETLRDVSRNSTGSEVLRSLGYWLFYQRDPAGPTTTASLDFLVSGRSILVSYAVGLVGLVGLWLVRWPHRRFAAWLIAVGALIAVGVHPIDSPSPLMRLLVGDETSSVALALRSSTRATPLLVLGLSLGAAALVASLPARVPGLPARISPPWRAVGAGALVLLIIVNLPSVWRFDLVDPAIDRDADPPAAWTEAADRLDGAPPDTPGGARVLQLPGAEFGAFRWGYTVDQPLVALVDRPLVTRDLLPLGSGPAMDLLYALDDRFQEGWAEPEAVPAVSRLLGADVIWVVNDAAFDRFRTARPEVVADLLTNGVDGLVEPIAIGAPEVNLGEVDTLDERTVADPRIGSPSAPVLLVGIDEPLGIIRTATASQVISGSGDGIVDTAAAGLLDPDAVIRYSLSLAGEELAEAIADAGGLTVTDSNRDRAHHWRGSQDVHGHTEPGGPDDDVLDATAADQRLAPFADSMPDQQTIAVQQGPVTAIASSYGEPFAYRPEDRAVRAIDGDPTTAWRVGDHGDPVGERLRLTIVDDVTTDGSIRLRQVAPRTGGRVIERVEIKFDDETLSVHLDERSWAAQDGQPDGQQADELVGQMVATPALAEGMTVEVEIAEVSVGDGAVVASRDGVGFVEVDLGLGATTEYVRPPVDGLDQVGEEPLTFVLTRLRVDPLDPWRSDPEPELQRQLPLPRDLDVSDEIGSDGDVELSVRVDARASDAVLARLFGDGPGTRPPLEAVPIADRRLTGSIVHRGAAASDGDTSTAWITPFDEALGASLRFDGTEPFASFELRQADGPYSTITALRLSDGSGTIDVQVPPPDGDGRSRVALARPLGGDGPLTFEIIGIEGATTVDRRYGDVRTLPVAIAELDAPGIGVRVPASADEVVGWECTSGALLEIDGTAVDVRFETTVGELVAGHPAVALPCGPIELAAGTRELRSTGRLEFGLTVDRLTIVEPALPPARAAPPTVRVLDDETRQRVVEVAACPSGCWLVLGEGFNEAWQASIDGTPLAGPELVDGGFNGWYLEASDESRVVVLRWTAQWPVTLGLALSLAGAVCCVVLVVAARRPRHEAAARRPRLGSFQQDAATTPIALPGLLLALVAAVTISPAWGLAGLGAMAVAALVRRRVRRPLEAIGVAAAIAVALLTYWIERRDAPLPTAGWTEAVARLSGPALFALLAIAIGASFEATRRPTDAGSSAPP